MRDYDFLAWKGTCKVHIARLVEWSRDASDTARVILWCRTDEAFMRARWAMVDGRQPDHVTCKRCLRYVARRAADWNRIARLARRQRK